MHLQAQILSSGTVEIRSPHENYRMIGPNDLRYVLAATKRFIARRDSNHILAMSSQPGTSGVRETGTYFDARLRPRALVLDARGNSL